MDYLEIESSIPEGVEVGFRYPMEAKDYLRLVAEAVAADKMGYDHGAGGKFSPAATAFLKHLKFEDVLEQLTLIASISVSTGGMPFQYLGEEKKDRLEAKMKACEMMGLLREYFH